MARSVLFAGEAKPPNKLDSILAEFKKTYAHDGTKVIDAIPPVEMWRFSIDYPANEGLTEVKTGEAKETKETMRKNGWLPYTEPNYLKSLTSAFHLIAMTKLSRVGSENFIPDILSKLMSLRTICIHSVLDIEIATDFADSPTVYFGLEDKRNATIEGFFDIIEQVKQEDIVLGLLDHPTDDDAKESTTKIDKTTITYIAKDIPRVTKIIDELNEIGLNAKFVSIDDLNDAQLTMYYKDYIKRSTSKEAIVCSLTVGQHAVERKKIFLKYLREFERDFSVARTSHDQIKAIAIFTAKAVRYHPYSDGNARTIAILLLNELLINHGFPPSIVNPNFSGGYSYEQWTDEIIEGMQRSLDLAKNKTLPCIDTRSIFKYCTREEKQNFLSLSHTEKILREIRNHFIDEQDTDKKYIHDIVIEFQNLIFKHLLPDDALEHVLSLFQNYHSILKSETNLFEKCGTIRDITQKFLVLMGARFTSEFSSALQNLHDKYEGIAASDRSRLR